MTKPYYAPTDHDMGLCDVASRVFFKLGSGRSNVAFFPDLHRRYRCLLNHLDCSNLNARRLCAGHHTNSEGGVDQN